MAIILHLDEIMLKKHISLNDLSSKIGLTLANTSNIKTGKIKAIRFSTLNKLCEILECQPSDILEYTKD
ncbi:MAG: helix-turn-helix transcriptional regulator [Clostridia bacterium]